MSNVVREELWSKLRDAHGGKWFEHELALAKQALPQFDRVLAELAELPLAGAELTIAPESDRSGVGADIQFATAEQIVDQVTRFYPGIAAGKAGYLLVGLDALGGGDDFYLRVSDGAIVRIAHDSVAFPGGKGTEGVLDERGVETVSDSLEGLVQEATLPE